MKKRTWKKIALTAAAVVVVGIVVLPLHIWWVMRPRVDAKTRIMARIDINKPILKTDADRITAWLYQQKGVEHVLVSQQSDMAIFTYSPQKNNANTIAREFRQDLAYDHAVRIVPSEEEMAMGCPVAGASFAYKVYKFMNHIF
jgi:myo-inositol-hexaphosphate 3-phosphohydrolase